MEKDRISLELRKIGPFECPYCGYENSYYVSSYIKVTCWNPHAWDGSPHGSYWRGCSELAVKCQKCGDVFHLDCGYEA